MIPRVSDLREPPVVGRYYMVPVIDYTYHDRSDVWPTLGPRHTDKELVGFAPAHWHVDARFLTGAQAAFLRRQGWRGTVETVVAMAPLCTFQRELPARTRLERRRCRVSSWDYSPPGKRAWEPAFDKAFGKIAEPVRMADGRLLCPHKRADLSSFPPDADGIVTCPLHGLRVRCAA